MCVCSYAAAESYDTVLLNSYFLKKREREIYKKETVVVNEQRPNARQGKTKIYQS